MRGVHHCAEPLTSRLRRRKHALAACFIGVYLAVQVAVPLFGLVQRGGFLLVGDDMTDWHETQVRFSWQMFASVSQDAEYRVLRRDDSVDTVNSVHVLGRVRGRAHYADVSQRLCDELDGAVTVRRRGRSHRC